MHVKDVEIGFMIRLSRGEKVMQSLVDFCAKRGISGGVLQGIGAVCNAEIGYYDLKKREYAFKSFPEDREVAAMQGNIALVDGKPFVHAHALLSAGDDSLGVAGGHVREMEVAITLEIFLAPFNAPLSRAHAEEIGLNLLDL